MSVHDPAPSRKSSRLGLYLPVAIAIGLIVAWTAGWLWLRGQAQRRMDAAVAQLQAAGYQVGWSDRRIGGFPYRLNITLTDARVREPSGWALQAPKLEAQAYVHAPTHWLFAAQDGLTFVRPQGGPVQVSGRVIRASLTHPQNWPPSFSFQGLDLTFSPGPGARPFALQAAQKVEFHLRQGPDDEGGVFVSVEGGRAQLSGLLGRIAGDKPIAVTWNATLSKISAFHGSSWPAAVRRWTEAGGRMHVRQAGITAGEALISASGGELTVGSDGRLRGAIPAFLRQAPRALSAMGESGTIPRERADAAAAVTAARQEGDIARAVIGFEAGQTTLGPVAIGPAPKVYDVP
jgi:hypothetical protein